MLGTWPNCDPIPPAAPNQDAFALRESGDAFEGDQHCRGVGRDDCGRGDVEALGQERDEMRVRDCDLPVGTAAVDRQG